MKRFALLGDPVAHSKSPAMHAAAYRALHLECTYEAIRARPEDLPALVRALRDGSFDGFNVTVPHKTRILEHVDRLDASVTGVGAANTLVRAPDGKVVAHNTDVPALSAELVRLAPERTKDHWRASRAIVLGSGGAARSAVAALKRLGVRGIVIRSRSPRPAGGAGGQGGGVLEGVEVHEQPLSPSSDERDTLTIIQATSAGMTGADHGDAVAQAIDGSALPPRAVALDVVYAPPETPFLRAAQAHAIRSSNGLGMLAMQGALAFELWLGVPAPYNAMLAAIT